MHISSAHKKRLGTIARVATASAMVVSSLSVAVLSPVSAAQLNTNSTLISDSRLSGSGGSGVTYTIRFAPPSSSTTEIVQANFMFCVEAGAWTDTCTAPTGFDITGSPSATINNFGVTGGPNTLNAATRTAANQFNITTTGTGTAETTALHEVVVTGGMTNPSVAGTYYTRVRTYSDAGTTPIDDGESAFAVLSHVTVSGRVLESMTFTVGTVNSGVACGTYENATVTSTTNGVPFGNFLSGTPRVGCQTISTATNADGGYSTTIREVNGGTSPQGGMCRQTSANCVAEGGQAGVAAADVIVDTVLNGTPTTWTAGTTFGQGFGVSGAQRDTVNFTANNQYRSLFGATPILVSTYGDPTTSGASTVHVVFKADVSATQTAGMYQNAVEYVTTPIF